jgi:hypothetical protein
VRVTPVPRAFDSAVTLDSVIRLWHLAFDAADAALRAASAELPADELRLRTQRLAAERTDAVCLLDTFARDQTFSRR